MARYIYCTECNERKSQLATRFGEFYESLKGIAKKAMRCDSCDQVLLDGEECFAACMFREAGHFNYEKHKPSAWADEFIIV